MFLEAFYVACEIQRRRLVGVWEVRSEDDTKNIAEWKRTKGEKGRVKVKVKAMA